MTAECSVKSVVIEQLSKAGRQPELPLQVNLPSGESLQIEQWLRVLPGKRYVGRAQWQGKIVLAKLYVGVRADKKAAAEVAGIKHLLDAGLSTPALLTDGSTAANTGWVLTEFVEEASDLTCVAGLSVEGHRGALEGQVYACRVAECVAHMHRAGLVQQDIHPGNFLLKGDDCLVIDAADVVSDSHSTAMARNIGMLLAQLPPTWWYGVWQAWQSIAQGGGQRDGRAQEYDTVCAAARDWQAWRARDLAFKSVRDCSLFQVRHSFRCFESVWRQENKSLAPLLADLDGALARSEILKDGGSATVGRLDWQGRSLVIKRYNLKSFGHRLKRCWRPTRAWHSWQAGHRLRVLGVNTPRPVAMVEERCGSLRGRGYLITECSTGVDLVSAGEAGAKLSRLAAALQWVLQVFADHRISHGDFKATNLLWSDAGNGELEGGEGGLELIDLDAVCWHQKTAAWQRAKDKDVARLLRNWDESSPEYKCLQQALTDTNNRH